MRKRRSLVATGEDRTPIGDFTYYLYRDTRARRIKMRWQNDRGIVVVIPKSIAIKKALDFMMKNISWIQDQQFKWKQIEGNPDVPQLRIGGQVLYRGNLIPITSRHDDSSNPAAVFDESGVTLINPEDMKDHIEDVLVSLMKDVARSYLVPRTKDYADALKVPVNRISIRDQRTRWGSWSSRGNISLNWRLIMLPEDLITYVLLHELIHHFHPDHSKKFWDLLEVYCKGCKQKQATLKSYVYLTSLFR